MRLPPSGEATIARTAGAGDARRRGMEEESKARAVAEDLWREGVPNRSESVLRDRAESVCLLRHTTAETGAHHAAKSTEIKRKTRMESDFFFLLCSGVFLRRLRGHLRLLRSEVAAALSSIVAAALCTCWRRPQPRPPAPTQRRAPLQRPRDTHSSWTLPRKSPTDTRQEGRSGPGAPRTQRRRLDLRLHTAQRARMCRSAALLWHALCPAPLRGKRAAAA